MNKKIIWLMLGLIFLVGCKQEVYTPEIMINCMGIGEVGGVDLYCFSTYDYNTKESRVMCVDISKMEQLTEVK